MYSAIVRQSLGLISHWSGDHFCLYVQLLWQWKCLSWLLFSCTLVQKQDDVDVWVWLNGYLRANRSHEINNSYSSLLELNPAIWCVTRALTTQLWLHFETDLYIVQCTYCFNSLIMMMWQSCPELLDILKVGRFDELKQHLDGLVALYNVDGDKYVCLWQITYHWQLFYYLMMIIFYRCCYLFMHGCWTVIMATECICAAWIVRKLNCVCRKLKKQLYSAVQALEADLMSLNKLSRYANCF